MVLKNLYLLILICIIAYLLNNVRSTKQPRHRKVKSSGSKYYINNNKCVIVHGNPNTHPGKIFERQSACFLALRSAKKSRDMKSPEGRNRVPPRKKPMKKALASGVNTRKRLKGPGTRQRRKKVQLTQKKKHTSINALGSRKGRNQKVKKTVHRKNVLGKSIGQHNKGIKPNAYKKGKQSGRLRLRDKKRKKVQNKGKSNVAQLNRMQGDQPVKNDAKPKAVNKGNQTIHLKPKTPGNKTRTGKNKQKIKTNLSKTKGNNTLTGKRRKGRFTKKHLKTNTNSFYDPKTGQCYKYQNITKDGKRQKKIKLKESTCFYYEFADKSNKTCQKVVIIDKRIAPIKASIEKCSKAKVTVKRHLVKTNKTLEVPEDTTAIEATTAESPTTKYRYNIKTSRCEPISDDGKAPDAPKANRKVKTQKLDKKVPKGRQPKSVKLQKYKNKGKKRGQPKVQYKRPFVPRKKKLSPIRPTQKKGQRISPKRKILRRPQTKVQKTSQSRVGKRARKQVRSRSKRMAPKRNDKKQARKPKAKVVRRMNRPRQKYKRSRIQQGRGGRRKIRRKNYGKITDDEYRYYKNKTYDSKDLCQLDAPQKDSEDSEDETVYALCFKQCDKFDKQYCTESTDDCTYDYDGECVEFESSTKRDEFFKSNTSVTKTGADGLTFFSCTLKKEKIDNCKKKEDRCEYGDEVCTACKPEESNKLKETGYIKDVALQCFKDCLSENQVCERKDIDSCKSHEYPNCQMEAEETAQKLLKFPVPANAEIIECKGEKAQCEKSSRSYCWNEKSPCYKCSPEAAATIITSSKIKDTPVVCSLNCFTGYKICTKYNSDCNWHDNAAETCTYYTKAKADEMTKETLNAKKPLYVECTGSECKDKSNCVGEHNCTFCDSRNLYNNLIYKEQVTPVACLPLCDEEKYGDKQFCKQVSEDACDKSFSSCSREPNSKLTEKFKDNPDYNPTKYLLENFGEYTDVNDVQCLNSASWCKFCNDEDSVKFIKPTPAPTVEEPGDTVEEPIKPNNATKNNATKNSTEPGETVVTPQPPGPTATITDPSPNKNNTIPATVNPPIIPEDPKRGNGTGPVIAGNNSSSQAPVIKTVSVNTTISPPGPLPTTTQPQAPLPTTTQPPAPSPRTQETPKPPPVISTNTTTGLPTRPEPEPTTTTATVTEPTTTEEIIEEPDTPEPDTPEPSTESPLPETCTIPSGPKAGQCFLLEEAVKRASQTKVGEVVNYPAQLYGLVDRASKTSVNKLLGIFNDVGKDLTPMKALEGTAQLYGTDLCSAVYLVPFSPNVYQGIAENCFKLKRKLKRNKKMRQG